MLLLPVRHGDEWEGELLLASSSRLPHLQQGSMSASRRRSTTALLSPYSLAVGRPLQPRATRRRGTSATPESLHALISGVLQQRTEAGGYHRPASTTHGRKATLLVLYFPQTKKSEGKIYCLRHDAGPSGSSPAPVSVLWRSNSTATFFRCGAELQGPDCFFHFLSGVFYAKAQWLLVQARILLHASLLKKGILSVAEACCPICQAPEETATHIIFGCTITCQFWARVGGRHPPDTDVRLMHSYPAPAAIFPMTTSTFMLLYCWNIWKHMNIVVFREHRPSLPPFFSLAMRTPTSGRLAFPPASMLVLTLGSFA
ncbi:hypothetical protein QYE76_028133 [Lolium multiflorum]|uniref:Reverse transcriptase zinc-binding domain-containing protein n=1 Tax=Lolium multiflorum TaxID=4521 RepID=A0AAD8VH04_LOLMU|nr:hypothetical protein QYE76_028133 [Lolium multiflorum]